MKSPAVYMLASRPRGTLYIGVTSNLVQRVWQHREGLVSGFTAKYDVKTLVWYELHPTMESAITREKAMKGWRRVWKLQLVEGSNQKWRDLWPDIIGVPATAVIPAQAGIHCAGRNLDPRVRGDDGQAGAPAHRQRDEGGRDA